VANPNGYEYSRPECKGVDLNRNFPKGYGIGALKNPHSEVFNPLSEKEYIDISNYINSPSNMKATVSVHSKNSIIYSKAISRRSSIQEEDNLEVLLRK
jgi:murein tripeptide amidase MpaA